MNDSLANSTSLWQTDFISKLKGFYSAATKLFDIQNLGSIIFDNWVFSFLTLKWYFICKCLYVDGLNSKRFTIQNTYSPQDIFYVNWGVLLVVCEDEGLSRNLSTLNQNTEEFDRTQNLWRQQQQKTWKCFLLALISLLIFYPSNAQQHSNRSAGLSSNVEDCLSCSGTIWCSFVCVFE